MDLARPSALASPRCTLNRSVCQPYAPSPRLPRKLTPIVQAARAPTMNGDLQVERGLSRRPARAVSSTGVLRAASTQHRRLSALSSSPNPTGTNPPANCPSLRDRRIYPAPRPPPIMIPSSPEDDPAARNDCTCSLLESPELPSVTTWIVQDEQQRPNEHSRHARQPEEEQVEQASARGSTSAAEKNHNKALSTADEKHARGQQLEAVQHERRERLGSPLWTNLVATVHELMLETRRARLGHA